MLITHAQTGLTVAFIGTFIAVVTLVAAGKSAFELLKKVDYKTSTSTSTRQPSE